MWENHIIEGVFTQPDRRAWPSIWSGEDTRRPKAGGPLSAIMPTASRLWICLSCRQLLMMGHGRRQILWFGVTSDPTAEWIANHITEACGLTNSCCWSALGQTRKSGDAIATSALPRTADIPAAGCDVRKVPIGAAEECGADLCRLWARAKIATFNWPRRVTARRALDGCLQSTLGSSIRPRADLPTLEQCESPGVW